MDKRQYALLEQYMKACMGQDGCHDAEHVYRVLYGALLIAREEADVDMDVLIAACLLHDIARPEQLADPRVCHARAGGDKAYRFLLDNGFAEPFAAHVRSCIRTHRFRKGEPPESIEAKILYDADKLDVSGTIGLARTLAYGGEAGEPVYTREPDGSVCDGAGDAPESFFHEYRFKLEGIYDRFLTPAGADLAKERQEAAAHFYRTLLQEVRSVCAPGIALLREQIGE